MKNLRQQLIDSIWWLNVLDFVQSTRSDSLDGPTRYSDHLQAEIVDSVLKIDFWLETMRGPDGYGGPVVHWWRDNLLYTGPGLDWRYEGIIIGYLNLFKRTGDRKWLDKASRAGDDLVRGQLLSGNFGNSSFELNPHIGGTPHEAACDLALIRLALSLRQLGITEWRVYASAAERNLQDFVIAVLWDEHRHRFRNSFGDHSFVPNKAATIAEALIAWSELAGDEAWSEQYARSTLDTICDCQIREPGAIYDGAIYQSVNDRSSNGRFFPLYIARCIPPLVKGYRRWEESRCLEAAKAAMKFILRYRYKDGSFPQVIYKSGHINRYPQWVAGVGDILRAIDELAAVGVEVDTGSTLTWLLRGIDPSVAIATGWGFAHQVIQGKPPDEPDFRDLLPVCGWVDKAFRYLSRHVEGLLQSDFTNSLDVKVPCTYGDQLGTYIETDTAISFHKGDNIIYRWRKGTAWAQIY